MKRRTFLKSLAGLALLPLASITRKPEPVPTQQFVAWDHGKHGSYRLLMERSPDGTITVLDEALYSAPVTSAKSYVTASRELNLEWNALIDSVANDFFRKT